MAASTFSSNKASYGNFNKYIVDKIKSAASMAASERKARKELDPDIETAKGYYFGKALSAEFGGDLIRRTRGTFSKDPSSTEDPSLSKKQRFSNLISGEIAAAAPAEKQLELPLDIPEDKKSIPVEDKGLKSWLSTMLIGIKKSNTLIADKISVLSNQEKDESTSEDDKNKSFSALFNSIKTLKNYFNKDNKISEEENRIEEEQLEFVLDAKDESELAARESNLESTTDNTNLFSADPVKVKKEDTDQGGGLLGSLFGIADLFDFDLPDRRRRSRRNRRNRRPPRAPGRSRNPFRGFRNPLSGRGIGGLTKGLGGRILGPVLGDMIFPEAAGSSEPQMGPDGKFRLPNGSEPPSSRRKLSEGGYNVSVMNQSNISNSTTNLPGQNKKKLSEGGVLGTTRSRTSPIGMNTGMFGQRNPKLSNGGFNTGVYDNPTTGFLQPGQSVIPLNRNNPVASVFRTMQQSKSPMGQLGMGEMDLVDPLAELIQAPAQAAGLLMLAMMPVMTETLGGVGRFMFPIIEKTLKPIARVFGAPPSIITSIFSGVSALGDQKSLVDFLSSNLGVGGKGGKRRPKPPAATPAPPPPPPDGAKYGPGMTASGGNTVAPGDIFSGFRTAERPGHNGIDISSANWTRGTPISVIKPGVVLETGWQDPNDHSKGWGQFVAIRHDDGSHTVYGHLDEINVRPGQRIDNVAGAATVIGKLGNTGKSDGPHLHFELGDGWDGEIKNHVNPAPYINNYIRGGGNVKIDAPQVTLPSQQPSPMPSGNPQSPRPGSGSNPVGEVLNRVLRGLGLQSAIPTSISMPVASVASPSGYGNGSSGLAAINSQAPFYQNTSIG